MSELRDSLAEDYRLCKDRKRRSALQERLAQIKRLLFWEVSKHERGLQTSRARIFALLTEVRAILTACERLTAEYFPGLKILFQSDAIVLNQLNLNATRSVDEHNKIADCIGANGNKLFGIKLAGRREKIEENAIDQAVEKRVASIVAFAKSEV